MSILLVPFSCVLDAREHMSMKRSTDEPTRRSV
jgi:hypothetical protein